VVTMANRAKPEQSHDYGEESDSLAALRAVRKQLLDRISPKHSSIGPSC
jgi:hypothetical protein